MSDTGDGQAPIVEPTVSILGVDVRVIEYKSEPVVTFAMVDQIHQRADGTAGRTFRENRERFVAGEDFTVGKLDEIRRAFPNAFPARGGGDVILITRRGYLKLVKPLTDDRAWAVQGEMIDRYFMIERIVEAIAEDPAQSSPDDLSAICQLMAATERSVSDMAEKIDDISKSVAKSSSTIPAVNAYTRDNVVKRFSDLMDEISNQSRGIQDLSRYIQERSIADYTREAMMIRALEKLTDSLGQIPNKSDATTSRMINSVEIVSRFAGHLPRSIFVDLNRRVTHEAIIWFSQKGSPAVLRPVGIGRSVSEFREDLVAEFWAECGSRILQEVHPTPEQRSA